MLAPLSAKNTQTGSVNNSSKKNSIAQMTLKRATAGGTFIQYEIDEKVPSSLIRHHRASYRKLNPEEIEELKRVSIYNTPTVNDYRLSSFTPYVHRIYSYPKLLLTNRRVSIGSTASVSLSTSSLYTSSREFVLKRQNFCRGEFTIAKNGRYNKLHPQLGSIALENLTYITSSIGILNLQQAQ